MTSDTALTLGYITAGFPGSHAKEAFFTPEIVCLHTRGHRVMLVPRVFRGPLLPALPESLIHQAHLGPLVSFAMLWVALGWLGRPIRLARLVGHCCLDWRSPMNTLKNVAVLPKGLWLGALAQQEKWDHLMVQWGATTATLGQIAHEASGIPWSLTVHRGDIVQNNKLLEKNRSAAFTRFISISGVDLFRQITGCGSEAPVRSLIQHMGVMLPTCEGASMAAPGAPFTVLCPARLIPVKGHQVLLEAMAALVRQGCECRLLLAGDGPLRGDLERWVIRHGLQAHIEFLGHVDQPALFELYCLQRVHTVVLPSLDLGGGLHEGIPVCLMEAMAHGIPVVTTPTGGIEELVDASCGVLVPPGNAAALAAALLRLQADPGAAQALGLNGQRRVRQDFNIEALVDGLVSQIRTCPRPGAQTQGEPSTPSFSHVRSSHEHPGA